MGSRYLFIVLYVLLEHHLSRGDYRRSDVPAAMPEVRPRGFLSGYRPRRSAARNLVTQRQPDLEHEETLR